MKRAIHLLIVGWIFFLPMLAHAEGVEPASAPQRPKNPVMRVLLGDALQPTKFIANNVFVVETADHTILITRAAGEEVTIAFTKKERYKIVFGSEEIFSDVAVRVTPMFLDDLVTVMNFEHRPAWDTTLNDNFFNGSVEVVYSAISNRVLLVNEIPIERYIRGIAEGSNSQPTEYLKALMTAARTYALWHILNPTKHAGEPYILDATEGDQVYRGAGFSARSPHVVAAQKATKKRVLFYDGEPIIAPYFSRSDGRTRAWSEVWNGEYPWAQSVVDPCCADKKLLGHGVGMSGEGARYFATQEGWDWRDILKYYYTDVEIKKRF